MRLLGGRSTRLDSAQRGVAWREDSRRLAARQLRTCVHKKKKKSKESEYAVSSRTGNEIRLAAPPKVRAHIVLLRVYVYIRATDAENRLDGASPGTRCVFNAADATIETLVLGSSRAQYVADVFI